MNIAFFSGDITRSGGTENVGVMIANALATMGDYHISFISLFEESDKPFFDIDERIDRIALYPVPTHGMQTVEEGGEGSPHRCVDRYRRHP